MVREFDDLDDATTWAENEIDVLDPYFIPCDNDSFVRAREIEAFKIINMDEVR